jgi:hypothetical protein
MGLWPSLPDIKPCNFYLCGMLKDKGTESNNLHIEERLKESIQNSFLFSSPELQCSKNTCLLSVTDL